MSFRTPMAMPPRSRTDAASLFSNATYGPMPATHRAILLDAAKVDLPLVVEFVE